MHIANEIQPSLGLVIFRAVSGESVPLANAVRDDAASQVRGPLAGSGIGFDIRGISRLIEEIQIAIAWKVLRSRHPREGTRRHYSQKPFRAAHRLGGGAVDDAAGVVVGAGATGAVDTPLAIPFAPLSIWMFFMLGSDRKPTPSSRRFGSVITNALSLEIWFFC
jgi:hypothetical protein